MPKSYASAVINASADTVWSYVRDFANLDEWLPSIETCDVQDDMPADQIGAIRRLTALGGDAVFHERLVSFDDEERSYAYEFVDSPLPVRNYRSQIRVAPVTDSGQAFVEWWGDFDADEKDLEAMRGFFTTGVYGSGLEALRKRFG
jgi:ribosome-associated toxin RatA of RatAB toxin-antitoxin module